jgi:hypothetical protein
VTANAASPRTWDWRAIFLIGKLEYIKVALGDDCFSYAGF